MPEGRFAEVNLEMRKGATLTYRWGAAEPLAFNIHTHRDGETQYVVEETTPGMEGTLTADEDGGYSLMWAYGETLPVSTSGRSVELWYHVDGDYTLHSAVG